ncbi:MAG TPA: Glu/Leu/Phe/Val dehydrogenase dimerization domain-containing protein [Terriglobales bacterium]
MASAVATPALRPRETASHTAQLNFQLAAAALGLDNNIQAVLTTPLRERLVEIPVRMDDGRTQPFTGVRIQHNNARGPVLGGIRFTPNLDLELARALAEVTTWKTALMAVPFGGASGGVSCDPPALSKSELERLTRQFVSHIHGMIGPYQDVAMPDLNANSQIMGWMFEQYAGSPQGHTAGAIAGKPLQCGGSAGRERASGRGVALMLRESARDLDLELKNLKVAIYGFGNVGSHAAQAIAEMGCRIVAISDIHGGVYSEKGLSLRDLQKHVRKHGSLARFSEAAPLSNTELLECECDVLVLAAVESVVNSGNADQVRARLILEGADLAITSTADELLHARGVAVVPDLLAGAGGAIASYLEWAQNLQRTAWSEEQVMRELEILMLRAYRSATTRARERKQLLRTAAYSMGIERVARCERLRAQQSPRG